MGHLTSSPDIDAVTALIEECAETLILPRFRRLRAEDIESKATASDPDDVVTVVDHEVEERLTRAFRDLVPASMVVAEEAVHSEPDLLRSTETDGPLWLLDPLDGTRNFARGDDGFGVMVAWVVGGRARAAWIVLPARHETFVAEEGSGVLRNGLRVMVPAGSPGRPWRGSAYVRYMPAELGDFVTRALSGRFDISAQAACSAIEYTDVLAGRKEFAIYYRLLPWDHAPPALILTEGGGCVNHVDGQPYGLRSRNQVTVVASDELVSRELRRRLTLDPSNSSIARSPDQ